MIRIFKCQCLTFCETLSRYTTKRMFNRGLHILKKNCLMSSNQSYSVRQWHSRMAVSKLDGLLGSFHSNRFPLVVSRFYSGMDDDKLVKDWMKQIKKDFENDSKKFIENTESQSVPVDSNSEAGTNDADDVVTVDMNDFDDAVEKLEKHGFTVEEIIDLLKKSNNLNDEFFSEESSDNGSSSDDKESDIESGSSSDSDNEEKVSDKVEAVDDNDDEKSKMDKPEWSVVKMEGGIKSEWSEIEIEDFANIAEIEPDMEDEWVPPVPLIRGKSGVFDVDEVVTILRHANAKDIFTVHIPPHLDFADYMIIVSAKSIRHMKAMMSDLHWIYKRRMNKRDKVFRIEGEKSDWQAVDLGNVILHIFMPDTRQLYDLETLWTVGAKFDTQCIEQSDPYTYTVDDLPWLKDFQKASSNTDRASVDLDQKADV
ncbi:hypothetical protein ACF0H5_023679 [Mactra antiquata]